MCNSLFFWSTWAWNHSEFKIKHSPHGKNLKKQIVECVPVAATSRTPISILYDSDICSVLCKLWAVVEKRLVSSLGTQIWKKKQGRPRWDLSISQQKAFKACWANVREGCEGFGEDINQALTDCVFWYHNLTNAITDPSVKLEDRRKTPGTVQQEKQMFPYQRCRGWGLWVICWLMR